MQRREQGAPPENEAPQDIRTGFVGDEGAVSVADCNMIVSEGPLGSACRPCGFLGPHYAWLLCGACGRWVHWLPKPRPVVQEGRS
jgi:hypothetical protein